MTIGIDPPPSRRVVDRYGFWGILFGIGVLLVMAVVALVLATVEGIKWAYHKLGDM